MNRKLLKWLPVAVVPAVIAGGALVAHATSDVNLPTKTPEQVLALAQKATPQQLSGQFTQTSNLGLPSLPSSGSAGNGSASSGPTGGPESGSSSNSGLASALNLASGTHKARVYVGGPSKSRIQVLDQLAERDVVRNGRTVWTYDSSKHTAIHATLPPAKAAHGPNSRHADARTSSKSPDQTVKKFLSTVKPTTRVQLGNDTKVAGRSAYDLVLTPRTSQTLIGSVSIAVDAKTGMALSVAVTARGHDKPAIKTAFTSLTLAKPAASRFTFTPPDGTKVTNKTIKMPAKNGARKSAKRHDPVVSGHGWTSIVEIPATGDSAKRSHKESSAIAALTKHVDGGQLMSTSLVNVLLTKDGRTFIGAVPASALQAAANK